MDGVTWSRRNIEVQAFNKRTPENRSVDSTHTPHPTPTHLGPVREGAELRVQRLEGLHVLVEGPRDGLPPLGGLPCLCLWVVSVGRG